MRGYITTLKPNGDSGGSYSVTQVKTVIGRGEDCSIRILIPTIANRHCEILAPLMKQASLRNLNETSHTLLNGISISPTSKHLLNHLDIITVEGRHLRWEYPTSSKFYCENNGDVGSRTMAGMVEVPLSIIKERKRSTELKEKNKVCSASAAEKKKGINAKVIHQPLKSSLLASKIKKLTSLKKATLIKHMKTNKIRIGTSEISSTPMKITTPKPIKDKKTSIVRYKIPTIHMLSPIRTATLKKSIKTPNTPAVRFKTPNKNGTIPIKENSTKYKKSMETPVVNKNRMTPMKTATPKLGKSTKTPVSKLQTIKKRTSSMKTTTCSAKSTISSVAKSKSSNKKKMTPTKAATPKVGKIMKTSVYKLETPNENRITPIKTNSVISKKSTKTPVVNKNRMTPMKTATPKLRKSTKTPVSKLQITIKKRRSSIKTPTYSAKSTISAVAKSKSPNKKKMTPMKVVTPKVKKSMKTSVYKLETPNENRITPIKTNSVKSKKSTKTPVVNKNRMTPMKTTTPKLRKSTKTPNKNRTSLIKTLIHSTKTIKTPIDILKTPNKNRMSPMKTTDHSAEIIKTHSRNKLTFMSTPKSLQTKSLVKSRFSVLGPNRGDLKTQDNLGRSNKKRNLKDAEAEAVNAAKQLKLGSPDIYDKNKTAALLVCHGRKGRSPSKVSPTKGSSKRITPELNKRQSITSFLQEQSQITTDKGISDTTPLMLVDKEGTNSFSYDIKITPKNRNFTDSNSVMKCDSPNKFLMDSRPTTSTKPDVMFEEIYNILPGDSANNVNEGNNEFDLDDFSLVLSESSSNSSIHLVNSGTRHSFSPSNITESGKQTISPIMQQNISPSKKSPAKNLDDLFLRSSSFTASTSHGKTLNSNKISLDFGESSDENEHNTSPLYTDGYFSPLVLSPSTSKLSAKSEIQESSKKDISPGFESNSKSSSSLNESTQKRIRKPKYRRKSIQSTPQSPEVSYTGVKDLFKQNHTAADYTNVIGVKRMFGSPLNKTSYLDVTGIRRMFNEVNSPKSTDFSGIETFFDSSSPVQHKEQPLNLDEMKSSNQWHFSSVSSMNAVEKEETPKTRRGRKRSESSMTAAVTRETRQGRKKRGSLITSGENQGAPKTKQMREKSELSTTGIEKQEIPKTRQRGKKSESSMTAAVTRETRQGRKKRGSLITSGENQGAPKTKQMREKSELSTTGIEKQEIPKTRQRVKKSESSMTAAVTRETRQGRKKSESLMIAVDRFEGPKTRQGTKKSELTMTAVGKKEASKSESLMIAVEKLKGPKTRQGSKKSESSMIGVEKVKDSKPRQVRKKSGSLKTALVKQETSKTRRVGKKSGSSLSIVKEIESPKTRQGRKKSGSSITTVEKLKVSKTRHGRKKSESLMTTAVEKKDAAKSEFSMTAVKKPKAPKTRQGRKKSSSDTSTTTVDKQEDSKTGREKKKSSSMRKEKPKQITRATRAKIA